MLSVYKNIVLKDLPQIAQNILAEFSDHKHFVLVGEMGLGKTTLIKAICVELGIEEQISSPTYSIVNEYIISENKEETHKVFHFDLYRLESQDELLDIAFEEYLDQDAFLFIEWPQLALDYLEDYILLELSAGEGETRNLSAKQVEN